MKIINQIEAILFNVIILYAKINPKEKKKKKYNIFSFEITFSRKSILKNLLNTKNWSSLELYNKIGLVEDCSTGKNKIGSFQDRI